MILPSSHHDLKSTDRISCTSQEHGGKCSSQVSSDGSAGTKLVVKEISFLRIYFFVAVSFNYQSKKWMQEEMNGTKVEVSATGKELSEYRWPVQESGHERNRESFTEQERH